MLFVRLVSISVPLLFFGDFWLLEYLGLRNNVYSFLGLGFSYCATLLAIYVNCCLFLTLVCYWCHLRASIYLILSLLSWKRVLIVDLEACWYEISTIYVLMFMISRFWTCCCWVIACIFKIVESWRGWGYLNISYYVDGFWFVSWGRGVWIKFWLLHYLVFGCSSC